MKQLFLNLQSALASGKNAVLCTIIASSGSTPRGAGAKMAVFEDASFLGTIGGGAVEFECIQKAVEIHGTHVSQVQGYRLRPNQIADIGMICGGDITVYFQYLSAASPETAQLLQAILDVLQLQTDSWLVTTIRDHAFWSMGLYDQIHGLRFTNAISEATLKTLCQKKAVLTDGNPQYYVEPLGKAGRVYIFGGGHVSQELVPVLSHVGFPVIVCENRAEFAKKELFPTAVQVVLDEFRQAIERLNISASDSLIIMTRGHQDDYLVLQQALRTQAGYIGVIGSRKKAAVTFERLERDGFCNLDIKRIHTPIGLPIAAETPAEIAISIAAEMIQHRAASQ